MKKRGFWRWFGILMVPAMLLVLSVTVSATSKVTFAKMFPDNVFRAYVTGTVLKDNSEPKGDNNVVTDAQLALIRAHNKVEVGSKGVKSLAGIEKFTSVTLLHCEGNQLTTLDLSKNPALEKLYCFSNKLTSLNVTRNPKLEIINCEDNKLTSLDVTKNPALTTLCCDKNQLKTLNVTKNPVLETLWCYYNQLTVLDVTKNPNLAELNVNYNGLTTLDVAKNPKLVELRVESNRLTTLDVTQNPKLEYLYCANNNLTELDVSKNPALKKLVGFISSTSVNRATAMYKNFVSLPPEWFLWDDAGICDSTGIQSLSDLQYVRNLAEEVTRDCTGTEEKIRAVAEYIAKNICYAHTHGTYNSTGAYDVLQNGYAVCEGYARTYEAMLQSIGIPCCYVLAPDHAYNLVYNGKRWMLIDTTCMSNGLYINGQMQKSDLVSYVWYDFSLEQA